MLSLPQIKNEILIFQSRWRGDLGTDEINPDQITCVDCQWNDDCEFSWDLYNTHGDCLALK